MTLSGIAHSHVLKRAAEALCSKNSIQWKKRTVRTLKGFIIIILYVIWSSAVEDRMSLESHCKSLAWCFAVQWKNAPSEGFSLLAVKNRMR